MRVKTVMATPGVDGKVFTQCVTFAGPDRPGEGGRRCERAATEARKQRSVAEKVGLARGWAPKPARWAPRLHPRFHERRPFAPPEEDEVGVVAATWQGT